MLELKSVKKDYTAGSGVVHALRGIDLQFRENEFVSILGPSGCGKTTMLNIIGGLDQYTSGDLVINGRSTKDFKSRDWDAYRNHSIGFVFQSYNLIPHQSVLQNVELALTLSGVGRSQRRKRAVAALQAVGLGDQLRKKPSQLSGGQMQRVAIARALVNDPDIILADEPTGALDSETSVQVMEILKEVAKDRLVIMVTHNPELADAYSSRIIRMLDGVLLSDSAPLTQEELAAYRAADKEKNQARKKEKKPSMKWGTAFMLSLKNLFAKFGRTTLTSFAGSIGIIGIALIYAVSLGMTTYINAVQEDTLSSYPLTIQATTMDLGTLMSTFLEASHSNAEHDKDAVYSKPLAHDLINALNNMETTENDLVAFKAYIEEQMKDPNSKLSSALNGIQYTYNLDLPVYTNNGSSIVRSDAEQLLQKLMAKYMGMDFSSMTGSTMATNPMMSLMTSSPMGSFKVWQEILPGDNGDPINSLVKDQYDKIYGSWPNSYDEIVLVLDENNELDDLTLYALGLKTEEEMNVIMEAAMSGKPLDTTLDSWSYEAICGLEFRVILPGDCYTYDAATGLYVDQRETEAGLAYLYNQKAITLKVTGIIRPNEDAVSAMLSGSIGYTSKLTEYVIQNGAQSDAVKAQLESPMTDILNGLPFRESTASMTAEEKAAKFLAHLETLDQAGLADTYIKIKSIAPQEMIDAQVAQTLGAMTRDQKNATLIQATMQQTGMSEAEITAYITSMSDEDIDKLIAQGITEQFKSMYAQQVKAQLGAMTVQQLAMALTFEKASFTAEQSALYFDQVLEFSESTYEDNLIALGCLDLDDPASINLYASSFENKDVIEEVIAGYNAGVEDAKQIQYTDYVGLMMSGITTIINAITIVLIGFVAISLIVSSIMIGVITLISVQERTKEIGILRAIGASKWNVSSMFNAETIMIGAASGAVGVGMTYLLCIPLNAIIYYFTNIPNLRAFLPLPIAAVLIFISIFLSVFAGFIPSFSAATKDPVVALRTE